MAKLFFLQTIRSVAATLVVVDHSLDKAGLPGHAFGAFGVSIFFVISGFIIFYTSDQYFDIDGGSRRFLIRRFFRVAPMYYFATLLILIIDIINRKGDHTFFQVLTSLLFIPYWRDGDLLMRPVLGQGWTLVYEMYFYACFGFAISFGRRFGPLFVTCLFAVMSTIGAIYLYDGLTFREAANIGEFYISPILILFVGGVLIGVLKKRFPIRQIKMKTALVCTSALLCSTVVFLYETCPPAPTLMPLVLMWISAFAIVYLCVATNETDFPERLHWLSTLGDSSYSVYLFHEFAIIAIWALFKKFGLVSYVELFVSLSVVTSLIGATLVFNLLEKHISKPSFWIGRTKKTTISAVQPRNPPTQ